MDVVEGSACHVDLRHHHAHRLCLKHLRRRVGLDAVELIGLQVSTNAVEIAAHQAEHAGIGVLDRAELDLVDPFRTPALEMVWEAFGNKADCRIELRHLVSTRAGRVLRQPGFGVVAILLVLFHQRAVDDVNLRYDREEDR